MSQKKLYLSILALLTLAVFMTVFAFMPRIPQWIGYHHFSDMRTIAGIPNFANVISNIAFILVSILGFLSLWQQWQNKNLTGKTMGL